LLLRLFHYAVGVLAALPCRRFLRFPGVAVDPSDGREELRANFSVGFAAQLLNGDDVEECANVDGLAVHLVVDRRRRHFIDYIDFIDFYDLSLMIFYVDKDFLK